jgi:hypothetical protein
MNKSKYRLMIAAFLLLLLGFFGYGLTATPHWPSQTEEYFLWWKGQPSVMKAHSFGYLGLSLTGVLILSAIGLVFLKSFSRHLFVVSICLLAILETIEPLPYLVTGSQMMIESFLGMLAGLIISLSYWGPVASEFK